MKGNKIKVQIFRMRHLHFLFILLLFIFMGCENSEYEIKKFFGLKTGEHLHIDVLVDVTNSRNLAEELPKDSALVVSLISHLGVNDNLEVYFIHARTFSHLERVFSASMPEEPGPEEINLKKARKKFLSGFSTKWTQAVKIVLDRGYDRSTDLTGSFLFLKEHQIKSVEHRIVIISDMLAVRLPDWNFERKPPDQNMINIWKEKQLIPELKNRKFYIFGALPLPNMSENHYMAVRNFWKIYFKEARADLICYQYQRDLSLVLSLD